MEMDERTRGGPMGIDDVRLDENGETDRMCQS